ncbi:MAG: amidohydrolase [Saprospiraceae bacterium]
MQDITISTVQTNLIWENQKANLSHLDQLLSPLQNKTDLIVLPEMFTTGFTMSAATVAEPMDGPAISWMRKKANELNSAITGSLIIEDQGKYYNRLIWMDPNGEFWQYDKKHLFTLAKEQETFTAGTEKLIVDFKGWKICPLICYDLRFPAWGRNQEGYDLLIYVANWPKPRAHHWKSLIIARAIENQSYVIGVNRVGKDGKGHLYSGDTSVVDYAGTLRYQVADVEDVFTTKLKYKAQQEYRSKLNFLPDRDRFTFS